MKMRTKIILKHPLREVRRMTHAPPQDWREQWGAPGMACTHMMELAQLHELLRSFHSPPEFFVMIDIGQIAERVRRAEALWQETRSGKQSDG